MDDVKVGDLIRDNDPRYVNRILMVGEDLDTHWYCWDANYASMPHVKIRKDRIFTDGKKRRYNFNLERIDG